MRLATLFAAAILPAGLMAAPAAEVDDCYVPPPPVASPTQSSPGESSSAGPAPTESSSAGPAPTESSAPSTPSCVISGNSEYVNCRASPSTDAEIVTRLTRDEAYGFKCVKKGECVTIKEFTNWYVDSSRDLIS